jgi:hypothetical protein
MDSNILNHPLDNIDVYVDLYDMLKPIYTREVYANKKYVVVSSIINLAAHIRGYYWTRHKKYARVFLVYGDGTAVQHRSYIPNFGDNQFKTTLNFAKNDEFIKSQLELVKILCAYIPGVYYVRKSVDFAVFAYSNAKDNVYPSIILSKSKYAYQIPAVLSKPKYNYQIQTGPDTVLFRPKKRSGMDTSYFVNYPLVVPAFYSSIRGDSTIKKIPFVSPKLLSVLMTMTGIRSYCIDSKINTTTAINMVYEAIMANRINNDYNSDIQYVYNALVGIAERMDITTFSNRFYTIDLIYQEALYKNTIEALDTSWCIDLNDSETIKEINNKYFIDNPLDLEYL